MLYRFVHEMRTGDLIVYPSKADRNIHIGRVASDYRYAPQYRAYPNTRNVEWLRMVSRLKFSQGALYEIGSAVSLFQIKNFSDEFVQAAFDAKITDATITEDQTIPHLRTETELSTGDFILKVLAKELKGHPFASFFAHVMNVMGYHTRVSPEGTDGGVDIIAHKDELGFEPPIIKVQVKSVESSIGDPVVSALYGKVDSKEFGLLVTLGTFTNQAKQFARSKSNLRLIDGNDLVQLILAHYERFDSRYKSLLPLKRVYVPDPENAED